MLRFTREMYSSGLSVLKQNEFAQVFASENGLHAMGFFGKRNKPEFNHSFKSPERMTAFVDGWLEKIVQGQKSRAEYKAKRREEEKAGAERLAAQLEPGAIVYTSWGYDQTNIDFYQVTRRAGRAVFLRRICSDLTETGFMSGRTSAIKDTFNTRYPEEFKVIIRSGYLKIDDHCGNLWDGEPKYCSWYA